MELIKEIVYLDPPTKWTLAYKKEKFDTKGKLVTHQDFYLTANLFYSDRTSYHLTSKIVYDCKLFLFEKMKGIPNLQKIRVDFEYYHTKHIDIDNKHYFWFKLFMDILKTPTHKQVLKQKNQIITTNTIEDDNTKFLTEYNAKFFLGEHKMVFKIYGEIKNEQQTLF